MKVLQRDESRGISLHQRDYGYSSIIPTNDDDEAPQDKLGLEQVQGKATLSTIYAILYQPRLDALLACDAHLISYDPFSFQMVFGLRGRNFRMICAPLAFLLLWDICWAWLLMDGHDALPGPMHAPAIFASLDGLISPLVTPVSFLLVFRLGRAAVRFWDSRAAFGKLVELCRDVASTAAVACKYRRRGELRDGFARWVCAFPIATKNFLRPDLPCAKDRMSRRNEIGPLLAEGDAREVLTPVNGGGSMEFIAPILVLDRLRELAYRLSFENDDNSASNSSMQQTQNGMALYRQLSNQIDALNGAWGAMERIAATPLPFVYVVHLRTFLLLYLFLWNLQGVGKHGWHAMPALLAASWALLGIEAAAVECERPYQLHANHLPLGKMCVVVAKNVAQTLRAVGC